MWKTIVVGTDGSERADQAVDAAAELARLTGGVVHVVCAWSTASPGAAFGVVTTADPSGAQAITAEAAQRVRKAHVAAVEHQITTIAADALCLVATAVDADLIVVGNRGMTGKARLLGSVPNTVAHKAPCSVLVVQTDAG